MSRIAVTGLLVAALLAGAPGSGGAQVANQPAQPAAEAEPVSLVEVSGVLARTVVHGHMHYEVNGYLLMGFDPAQFSSFVGKSVTVRGALLNSPSIYMRKMIQVQLFEPKDAVGIPAEPPYRLYFGKVEQDCGDYVLVARESGPRLRLTGADLAHLLGRLAAVAAEEEILADDSRLYRVHQAVPVSGDLTPYLGTIYHRPDPEIRVTVYGQPLEMDQAPIMANARALVGLRAVVEATGAQVEWDAAQQRVTVYRGTKQVSLHIGSPKVIVQEAGYGPITFYADIAPVLVGGRTMVPIRVLADGLGLKVVWDEPTWTVQIL